MYYSNDLIIALVIIQAFVFAVMAGAIAGSKDRSVACWAVIWAVFSVLGLLAAVGMADENVKRTNVLLEKQNKILARMEESMKSEEKEPEPPLPFNNTPGTIA